MKLTSKTLNHASLQSLSPIEKITKLGQPLIEALQNALQFLSRELTRREDPLRVWQDSDRHPNTWSASNSQTGQSIHHVSEDELRRWIEHQYNQQSMPDIEQHLTMMAMARH
ncbi:MAG: hypothetical protein AAFQ57_07690 [Cyanobacteria bacterium J06626_14]